MATKCFGSDCPSARFEFHFTLKTSTGFLAKNGNVVSAEQSFKQALQLTRKVSDPIAKGVIATQLDRIKSLEGEEMNTVVVSHN